MCKLTYNGTSTGCDLTLTWIRLGFVVLSSVGAHHRAQRMAPTDGRSSKPDQFKYTRQTPRLCCSDSQGALCSSCHPTEPRTYPLIPPKTHFSWTKKQQKTFLFTGFEPQEEKTPTLELEEAVKLYLIHKRNSGKAVTTVDQYERELKEAVTFFKNKALDTFTASNFQEFADWLSNKVNTIGRNKGHKPLPTTVEKHSKALKRCFKYHRGLDVGGM